MTRAVLIAACAGVIIGIGLLTYCLFSLITQEEGFEQEWDGKEGQCLEDPACDLRKHDRMRENAEQKGDGVALQLGALGALLMAGGMFTLFSFELWRETA